MTLRHYGRALAAASGAVLLCATLSVPALATPSSDTGAAAPVAASATDEGSAPHHRHRHLHQQHRQHYHRLPGGLEPVRRPHHRRS